MSDVEKQLKRIQDKLQQVLKEHAALQKENLRLKEELDKNRTQSFANQQNIQDLKQQVDVLKITSGDWDPNDRKNLKNALILILKKLTVALLY